MPITQDRLIALIEVASYYKERDERLRQEMMEANQVLGEGRENALNDVMMAAYDKADPEYAITLAKEDIHVKYSRTRNDRAKKRQQYLRDIAAGREPEYEVPGMQSYERKNTPRKGFARTARTEAPELPKNLTAELTQGHSPDIIQQSKLGSSPNLNGRPVFEPGYDPNCVPAISFGKKG